SEEPGAVRPERLEDVHDEPFILLALPQVALERRVVLGVANSPDRGDELLVRLWWTKTIPGEQVAAVIEKADVHVPRQRPDAVLVRARRPGAREVGGELVGRELRREIDQPAGTGELGNPDAVEHHDVEARAPALEVDDVELVLIVGRPRQRLALDPHPRMRPLELAQEPGHRIAFAEDAGILEHERDGLAL